MEKVEILRIKKLGDLINLLTGREWSYHFGDYRLGLAGNVTQSHQWSNGECGEEVISDRKLMEWLCRPKGLCLLIEGTHTGNCEGDITAKVAVHKQHGLYFVTKKWQDEQEPRLLAVISINKSY